MSRRPAKVGKRATYPAYKPSGVEWLGDVPEHWEIGNIRRFAAMKTGHTPSRSRPEYWQACTIPWFTLADVWQLRDGRRKYLGDTEERISQLGLDNSAAELLPTSTVVFSRTASIGFCGIMPQPMATSQDFWNWVCGPKLLPEYLLQTFRAMRQEFQAITMGSTHKTIYQPIAAAIKICVPPALEQKAIAAFLDRETARIDALIEKKRRQIELLQEKRSALISSMVTGQVSIIKDPESGRLRTATDEEVRSMNNEQRSMIIVDCSLKQDSGIEWLGKIPKHWKVLPLKRVSRLQTGLTLGKKYENRELVCRPYLRVANVQDGYLDLSMITEVELPAEEVKRYELQRGDVLMTEGGDFDKLGRGYVWDAQIPACLHQNHIFCVRCDARLLHPLYLAWMTSSSHGKAYFTSTAQQTTNLASTNSFKIKAFPTLLPPVGEQEAIIQNISKNTSQIDALISKVEKSAATLREHRSALISAAVTGKIDVRSMNRDQ